jgi:hypothetical protein
MNRPSGIIHRLLVAGLLAGIALLCTQLSADAATPPKLTGSIIGSAKRGARITFRLNAVVPGGFQNLATLQIALLLHSAILDQITYDQSHNAISTPSSLAVPVGSRFVVTGLFLQSSGRDVSVNTSGDRMTVVVRAGMLQDAPSGSQFSLGAVDDLNQVARITRAVQLPPPPKGGFSWGDLALAALAALFVGGFAGNLLSGTRREAARSKTDVYDMVEKELKRQPVRT